MGLGKRYIIAVLHAIDTSCKTRPVPTTPLCNNAAVDGKNAQSLSRQRQNPISNVQMSQQHLLLFVSALFDGSRSIFVPDVIGFCAASPPSSALLETIR